MAILDVSALRADLSAIFSALPFSAVTVVAAPALILAPVTDPVEVLAIFFAFFPVLANSSFSMMLLRLLPLASCVASAFFSFLMNSSFVILTDCAMAAEFKTC